MAALSQPSADLSHNGNTFRSNCTINVKNRSRPEISSRTAPTFIIRELLMLSVEFAYVAQLAAVIAGCGGDRVAAAVVEGPGAAAEVHFPEQQTVLRRSV